MRVAVEGAPAEASEERPAVGYDERESVRRLLDSGADPADRLVEPGSYDIVSEYILDAQAGMLVAFDG